MKKILVAAAMIVSASFINAASVNWQVAGTAATENYTVYLLTSIAESYESVADIAAASVGSANIVKAGRAYSTGTQLASGDAVTKTATYYYAIVSGDSATSYTYVEATGLAGKVYDPAAQEASSGAFSDISAANILAGTSKEFAATGTPEPTSGLLLLLGMAGLALKRKRV